MTKMNFADNITEFVMAFLLFMVIDQIWLGLISRNYYATYYEQIQKSPYRPHKPLAMVVYALLAAGVALFVIPHVKRTMRLKDAFLWGSLFGLISYGINDISNQAIFENWSWHLTVIDVLWGAFLGAVVTAMVHTLLHR